MTPGEREAAGGLTPPQSPRKSPSPGPRRPSASPKKRASPSPRKVDGVELGPGVSARRLTSKERHQVRVKDAEALAALAKAGGGASPKRMASPRKSASPRRSKSPRKSPQRGATPPARRGTVAADLLADEDGRLPMTPLHWDVEAANASVGEHPTASAPSPGRKPSRSKSPKKGKGKGKGKGDKGRKGRFRPWQVPGALAKAKPKGQGKQQRKVVVIPGKDAPRGAGKKDGQS